MRRIAFLMFAVTTVASVITYKIPLHSDNRMRIRLPSRYLTKMPSGYRNWMLISVAHEEGNLHSFAAILGNDAAIKAYREGKLPYPDGTIIAALHYGHVPSQEKRQSLWQSSIFRSRGPHKHPVHRQGLEKVRGDGWLGLLVTFNKDGTIGNDALMKSCFPCHAKASRDFVFTRYAP